MPVGDIYLLETEPEETEDIAMDAVPKLYDEWNDDIGGIELRSHYNGVNFAVAQVMKYDPEEMDIQIVLPEHLVETVLWARTSGVKKLGIALGLIGLPFVVGAGPLGDEHARDVARRRAQQIIDELEEREVIVSKDDTETTPY